MEKPVLERLVTACEEAEDMADILGKKSNAASYQIKHIFLAMGHTFPSSLLLIKSTFLGHHFFVATV